MGKRRGYVFGVQAVTKGMPLNMVQQWLGLDHPGAT